MAAKGFYYEQTIFAFGLEHNRVDEIPDEEGSLKWRRWHIEERVSGFSVPRESFKHSCS
jgi:hypothetical protein